MNSKRLIALLRLLVFNPCAKPAEPAPRPALRCTCCGAVMLIVRRRIAPGAPPPPALAKPEPTAQAGSP